MTGKFPEIQLKTITAARGKADFPMEKGSFHYIDEVSDRTPLVICRNKEREEETCACPDETVSSCVNPADGLNAGTEVQTAALIDADGKVLGHMRFGSGGAIRRISIHMEDPSWNRFYLTFSTAPGEHYYGCGETFSEFDLRGQKVRIWVAEHQNSRRIERKLQDQEVYGKRPDEKKPFSDYESYYAQPTFVTSTRRFVHIDGSSFMEFDFTRDGEFGIEMREEADILIGEAEDYPALSELMSGFLGRVQPLPEWTGKGMILGVQKGPGEIEIRLADCAEHGIAVSGVWSQDWCGCRRTGFGYQVMWNWKADNKLYPGLKEKIADWKERGIRFLGYINPFLAIEKDLYAEAAEKGYCVKNRDGEDYLVTITTFPAAMIDLTNPDAREWYKSIIRDNMIGIGMSGWMADFGEYLPADAVLFDGSDPELIHNRWPAMWAKLNREAIREAGKEGEIFFFTRAGSAETIRYSTLMWNGDQHVDWSVDDGLASVIPASLSLAMSGYGVCHSDVGGYTTQPGMTRSKELFMRWAEMCAFSPLMRSHEGNQPSRNIHFNSDGEILDHLAGCVRWHMEITPYLRDLFREQAERGIPVMRPLFYHYDEPEAYTESYEYLLGPDLLIAPVLKEGAVTRDVYLPDDRWIHLFTGNEYGGGHVTVEAPLGEPPVFVRSGDD